MSDFLEKTYWIWLSIGVFVMVFAIQRCDNTNSEYPTEEGIGFNTIVVDSCEYIIGHTSYQGYMAHKGNCKYCKARNEKQ